MVGPGDRDSGVVAIGESTQYNREFFQLRHGLLRYLVERHGFSACAMESGFVEGWLVDALGPRWPGRALPGDGERHDLADGVVDLDARPAGVDPATQLQRREPCRLLRHRPAQLAGVPAARSGCRARLPGRGRPPVPGRPERPGDGTPSRRPARSRAASQQRGASATSTPTRTRWTPSTSSSTSLTSPPQTSPGRTCPLVPRCPGGIRWVDAAVNLGPPVDLPDWRSGHHHAPRSLPAAAAGPGGPHGTEVPTT